MKSHLLTFIRMSYLVLIFLLCVKNLLGEVSSSNETKNITILKNGFYLDIRNNQAVPFKEIITENGKITQINVSSHKNIITQENITDQSPNITSIDIGGGYVSPGLINAFSGMNLRNMNIDNWSRAGVTTTLLLGVNNSFNFINDIKKKKMRNFTFFDNRSIPYHQQSGDIFFSEELVVYGEPSQNDERTYLATRNITKIREAISFVKETFDKNGADILYVDVTERQGQRIPLEFLLIMVEGSHIRNKKVIAFSESTQDALWAVQHGVDAIHLNLTKNVKEDELLALAASSVYFLITPSIYRGIGKSKRMEETYQEMFQTSTNHLKKFIDAGGKFLIGNAYGYPWMKAGIPYEEINIHRTLGTPNQKILSALTVNTLDFLNTSSNTKNQDEQLAPNKKNSDNPIQVGQAADFIITKENPLSNIDALTNIRQVINDGYLIRDEDNQDYHWELGFSWNKSLTRLEILQTGLHPLIDSYPNTIHWVFALNFNSVLLHTIKKHFDLGIYTRWTSPSSRDWIESYFGYVFYQKGLFHWEGGYTYFFDQDFRYGIGPWIDYIPTQFIKTGLRFRIRRISYPSVGSGQWIQFDSFLNYENYQPERSEWITLRTSTFLDFYDLLPSWIDAINLQIDTEASYHIKRYFKESSDEDIMYQKNRYSLRHFLKILIDLRYWKFRYWHGKLWGDPLKRFYFSKSIGQYKTYGRWGRIDDGNIEKAILGVETSLKYSLISLGNLNFGIEFFWEMQKTSSSFFRIAKWDKDWEMDFGPSFLLTMGQQSFSMGIFFPVDYQGRVNDPAGFLSFTLLQ